MKRKSRYPGWLPASKEAYDKAKEYGIVVRFKPVYYPQTQKIRSLSSHSIAQHKNPYF